ncbi:hypothetical protein F2Q70_00006017, partial [Brassica cretica]
QVSSFTGVSQSHYVKANGLSTTSKLNSICKTSALSIQKRSNRSRKFSVSAEYGSRRGSGGGGGGGDFVAGFLLGGALFGAAAYIFAPQVMIPFNGGKTTCGEDIAGKEEEPGANHIACQANGSNSGDGLVKKVQQHTEEQESVGRKDVPMTVIDSEIPPRGQDNNYSQASQRKRPLWEVTGPATENQKVELSNERLSEGSANKKLKTENESSSSSFSQDTFGGEETRQEEEGTMGLLPFLAGRSNSGGEQSSSHSKGKEKEEDEDMDVSASLSLSLSFPGEERKNADKTPLFLFRDLPR